jgi:pullulanase/glycogen debranching enzyme
MTLPETTSSRWATTEGLPFPLGSTKIDEEDAYNFALYSKHAQSVNHITSHDGFTFYDLVAYNQKRNWHNGHDNTDGAEENYSWNCGWEGHEGAPPEVMKLRKQQIKNFCCLRFLSNGTPMFRAGDEFMHTQAGNSNPYNHDNETADSNRHKRRAIMYRRILEPLDGSRTSHLLMQAAGATIETSDDDNR